MVGNPNAYWEDIQGRRYPGYGRCIYCGSDGGADGLRDEHVVPFSLGGNTLIEKASCRSCERAINPVDTHLARSVYGQFRIHANVQTRNPKDRPPTLPANFDIGGEDRTVHLPVSDHPFALALPIWDLPGILRCSPIGEPFPETLWHIYSWTPPNLRETLGVPEGEDFRIWQEGRVNPALFARGIAKIAYCHAVIKFGLSGFRRLVMPDLILGKFSAVSHFVGVEKSDPPPPFSANALHAINFLELTPRPDYNNENRRWIKLHLAGIRLFANSGHKQNGMPIYHVIVGAPKLSHDNSS